MTNAEHAPLAGFTVIEHAEGVAASYAGRMLAVMGASVIKVEPPAGSALRTSEPLLTSEPPASALFHYLNTRKKFATCDLASAEGRTLFGRLLDRADVLIDDTPLAARPGLKLDAETITGNHPGLVYLSVLPFGADGVHADYRAYELNVLHAGGEGFLMPNGLALETFPERPPVKIYGHFAEFMGGTSATCAALAALMVRDEVGGQFVDVSVQDANISVGCFAIQRLGDGVLETRDTRSFKYGGVLECSDGYVGLLTLEERQWEGLVELMGNPEWAQEAALKDPLERGRRGKEINAHIRAWAKTQCIADVVAKGQQLGVPFAKYNEASDLLASDQLRQRKVFEPLDISSVGAVPAFTAPFQFDGAALELGWAAAEPGADNDAVWGESLDHQPDVKNRGRVGTA